MPTGYTARIHDGSVTTLKPFALGCAKAFLVQFREADGDVPRQVEAASTARYKEELVAAEQKLLALRSLTPDQARLKAKAEYEETLAIWQTYANKCIALRLRYKGILLAIAGWESTPELNNLRIFMKTQLEESMRFDCGEPLSWKPELKFWAVWWEEALKDANRDIDYLSRRLAQELKNTAETNRWLDALWASLEGVE